MHISQSDSNVYSVKRSRALLTFHISCPALKMERPQFAQRHWGKDIVRMFFKQATSIVQETGRGAPPISFDSWKSGWKLNKPPTRRGRRRSTRRTRNPRWSKKLGPWEPGGHPDERFARPTSLCLSSSQLNCQQFFDIWIVSSNSLNVNPPL